MMPRRVFQELFNAVLFSSLGAQWALSRPLLSVYLTYEKSLGDYFAYLQNQCAPEKHDKLNSVYMEIEQLSDRSLDAMSRDSFSMNLSKWRRQLLEVVYQRSFSVCLAMTCAPPYTVPFI
jgi:singapore isolate B (sub-type 7) whole genome shotgun sequence assembly, scaffold_0